MAPKRRIDVPSFAPPKKRHRRCLLLTPEEKDKKKKEKPTTFSMVAHNLAMLPLVLIQLIVSYDSYDLRDIIDDYVHETRHKCRSRGVYARVGDYFDLYGRPRAGNAGTYTEDMIRFHRVATEAVARLDVQTIEEYLEYSEPESHSDLLINYALIHYADPFSSFVEETSVILVQAHSLWEAHRKLYRTLRPLCSTDEQFVREFRSLAPVPFDANVAVILI